MTTLSEDAVREELKKVIDPELFVNIVDLGLIYVVTLHDDNEQASEPGGAAADAEAGADTDAGSQNDPGSEATAESDASGPSEASSDSQQPVDTDASPSSGGTNVTVEMTMTSPMCPAGPQLVAQSKQVVEAMEGVGKCEVKIVMDPPWTPDKMTDDARDQLGIF